ncbi:MAG: Na(+)/H(+) antiporter subunit F [Synergistetes bacterium ADurb.Bin155]|nr:cation:proton antiporter [Synergistales bacterium]OQB47237.1 MAG: Na(+)/H(+) antiporter subunit F [Synergistetes bacterium ADurb.Bin155]MBP8996566.1 cation:proton antiporter [Synergistales bacterium]HOC82789.1 monovalent cation/H+ antiporter complex subunit F [Synergistales bacterium]HOR54267.1 monovalent cation/H+ antiporter complex subunit F [Synergistales bacterium]
MIISYFAWAAAVTGFCALAMVGRLIAGPTVPDRVVALDSINTMVIALMIILSLVYDSVIMVDVAIVYAALSFVGTMFIARHVEGGV